MSHRLLALCLFGALLTPTSVVLGADKLAYYGLGPDGLPLPTDPVALAVEDQVIFHAHSHDKADPTRPMWLAPARVTPAGHHGDVTVTRERLAKTRDWPLEERARELVRILSEGPTTQERVELHAQPVFPDGTRIVSVDLSDANVIEIRAEFPPEYLEKLRSGDEAFDSFTHVLSDNVFTLPVSGFMILALDPETGEWAPIETFAPELDWGTSGETWIPEFTDRARNQFPQPLGGRPTGSLTHRTVYLNAGHGWTWRNGNFWAVQRSFVHNNVEDFSNADFVHGWVVPYLQRAGADVFTVREMDPNPNMVIVDNDDGAPDYIETGGWTNSTLAGFANGHFPYVHGENPFSFGTNRLVQCVVGAPTATASWIPTIPESGYYNVYVSHGAFTNRSPQAHYRVTHAGGDSDYFIDQRRHRFTWIFIGRYFFEAGRDPDMGKVVLSNSSTSATHFVSADAVRFGGGRGIIHRGSVGPSPYPNHDNEAIYHVQFMGAPTSAYVPTGTQHDESKGWSGRPLLGRWLEGQSVAHGAPYYPAVFLSNHTNATSAGTARGMISYLSSSITGSNTIHHRFRAAVHSRTLLNLQQDYGGNYATNSNPLRSGSFGEATPGNVNGGTPNTVPIFLGEWLFHDNAQDMALYHDPKFRRIMARGIYQGIVDYFASEVGGPATYLPEPPVNLRVRVINPTTVLLQWQAPPSATAMGHGHPATGYKIYQSTHGRGFAMGQPVLTGTTGAVQNLTPGETYFFQVTATNAGGESFATETLAVRMPDESTDAKLLIVNGYDKLDIATRVQTPYSSSVLYRQFLDQMNTQDYIVEHARAIATSGRNVTYDSAEHDAVEAGLVSLANYDAIIWIGGLQSEVSSGDPTNDTALKANTRALLAGYLFDGGNLFMSGAEIGWDLNRLSQSSFMSNILRMSWVSEGPQSVASGSPGSIFEGVNGIAFGGAGSVYPVRFPDVINATQGSMAAMEYADLSDTASVDEFDVIGQWRQPSFAGQTNADPSSTFAIVSSPVRSGTGSGRLNYVWGTGNYIRLYNQGLPAFPAASDFSIWMYGDNSGHRVRICLRDSDNDLFVSDWVILDFEGWREIVWEDVINNRQNVWVQSGNGTVDGPNVRFDSIHVQKVTAGNSGSIYFDDATFTSEGGGGGAVGPTAGVQYDGEYRLVYMGFPFETIHSADTRTQVMGRVIDFITDTGVVVPPPPAEEDRMMVY